jgi:hypothetical protein
MNPTNPLTLVRRLAANQASCTLFGVVVTELRKHGLDSDDLLEIIKSDLGEAHCFDSKVTEKYYPGTASDYYSIWLDECRGYMFLKLLIATVASAEPLVVTSFKKDDRRE